MLIAAAIALMVAAAAGGSQPANRGRVVTAKTVTGFPAGGPTAFDFRIDCVTLTAPGFSETFSLGHGEAVLPGGDAPHTLDIAATTHRLFQSDVPSTRPNVTVALTANRS